MAKCSPGYKKIEDQYITDATTVCGGTLQAIDLSTLISSSEASQNPEYSILIGSGNNVADIYIDGSTLKLDLKNPDKRPYSEAVIVSIKSDSFDYKVRVQVDFKSRCEGSECGANEYCDECTGDCVEGDVDLAASNGVTFGKVNLFAN